MNTEKEYKKRIKTLFFTSVKNDIKKWSKDGIDFESPQYDNINFRTDNRPLKANLELRICECIDYSHKVNYELICTYRILFIPVSLKVWWYIKKIKKSIKNRKKDEMKEESENRLKNGLSILESNFKKEIRKEKLENLK